MKSTIPLGLVSLASLLIALVVSVVLQGCTSADAASFFAEDSTAAAQVYSRMWSGLAACDDTLHASSDCFDDDTVTGWSTWDPATDSPTIAEGARGLSITASAGHTQLGVFKAYVAGDVTYTVHASSAGVWDTNTIGSRFALALTDDLGSAPTTADVFRVSSNEQTAIWGVESWTAYNTFNASPDSVANGDIANATSAWLRLCQDDTNDDLRGCVSPDGAVWKCSDEVTFAAALVDPPVHVALLQMTGAGTAYFDGFFVTETTDCYHAIGARIAP